MITQPVITLMLSCTDPTYKEWKLFHIFFHFFTLHLHGSYLQGMETLLSSQTTREPSAPHGSYLQGMETVFVIATSNDIWKRTDPTYKEWKLAHVRFCVTFVALHGSYLQGMETCSERKAFAVGWFMHGSYLQGMETEPGRPPQT